MKEIEIKVRIENAMNLKKFLEEQATFKYAHRQVDEYYTPAHRNFVEVVPIAEWLRLRDSNGAYSINYKHWHFEASGIANHCDEHETEVKDIEEARKILSALDFKYLVTVDKQRSAWRYEDYEIALDTVKDLGDFVEIEYKGNTETADPKDITDRMMGFLNKLDCGKVERSFDGYPQALLQK